MYFRTRKIKTFLAIASIVILASCSSDPGFENFINIDEEYEIIISQSLSNNGGIPSFTVKSISEYDCSNAFISYNTIHTVNKLEIILKDIATDGACINDPQIVSQKIDFNLVLGTKPIDIRLKEVISNTGEIQFKAETIELKLNSTDGLKISKSKINRIQPNMLWGSYIGGDANSMAEVKHYLEKINKEENLASGDYTFFKISPERVVSLSQEIPENAITFSFYTHEIFENFKSAIQEFKFSDPSLIFQATYYDGSTLNIQ